MIWSNQILLISLVCYTCSSIIISCDLVKPKSKSFLILLICYSSIIISCETERPLLMNFSSHCQWVFADHFLWLLRLGLADFMCVACELFCFYNFFCCCWTSQIKTWRWWSDQLTVKVMLDYWSCLINNLIDLKLTRLDGPDNCFVVCSTFKCIAPRMHNKIWVTFPVESHTVLSLPLKVLKKLLGL